MAKPVTPTALGEQISVHLQRFEADSVINKAHATYGTTPYYCARAGYYGGSKLAVTYVSYQGRSHLTKAEALAYLAWLDAGHVGRHFDSS